MLSIIIPAYNEAEILEKNALRLKAYLDERQIDAEVIVVSNGSTDQTVAIGERLQREHSWFRCIALPEKGPGTAFVAGVHAAQSNLIVTLDADLSSDLVFIDYARDLLQYSDMVVGSKTMGEQRRGFVRVLGSQLYILATQLVFNLTLSDFSMGCKAFKKEVILPHLEGLDSWTGYILELATLLKRSQKKILQVGVSCNDTRESHFNLLYEGYYRYQHLYKIWQKLRVSSL
jgi:glycosyltransferase involved in cell wall biosynthesis